MTNLEKAQGLLERLGRAVPWMQYAEAIVGLTEGVEDHDHERLTACLEASEALGLADRLTKERQAASEEVKVLEAGFVHEDAIKEQLETGRSIKSGTVTDDGWDHSGMTPSPALQKALDARLSIHSSLKMATAVRGARRL